MIFLNNYLKKLNLSTKDSLLNDFFIERYLNIRTSTCINKE